MRVVVAMSGGVDSSTTAALLLEQGHEVIGLAMKTHDLAPRANRACCTPDDMRDARRVAEILQIPFYVLDYVELFEQLIVKPFAESYLKGQTPNPCVICNDKVKFAPLLQRAKLLGADKLATGHYAKIRQEEGRFLIECADDAQKDQSYFLYRLSQEALSQIIFPLGGMCKEEVRQVAKRFGLPVANKQESQEICFVDSAGYAKTVESISGQKPQAGLICHIETNEILGEHLGIHHFTIGQRRGLGVAYAEPLYVVDLDVAQAIVYVGPKAALLTSSLRLHETLTHLPVSEKPRTVWVKQRYREVPKEALWYEEAEGFRLEFKEPVPRGAPGQACVLYQDRCVVAGGSIAQLGQSPQQRVGLKIVDGIQATQPYQAASHAEYTGVV